MKRPPFSILLIITFILFSSTPLYASTVSYKIIHSQDQYQTGTIYPIIIQFAIEDSWYLHGIKEEDSGLIPTALSFENSAFIRMDRLRFQEPERKKFEYTDEPIEVYSGTFRVSAILRIGLDAPSKDYLIQGKMSYQACSDKVCLPPEEISVKIPLTVVPQGTPVRDLNQETFKDLNLHTYVQTDLPGIQPGAGFWFKLLFIFLGGLALNLTPCIYPLIPITVSYFGGRRGTAIFTHTILHGILYLAGLSVTNSILGVTSALSGGMLGSALQNPIVLIFVAIVMIILGLSFFGFWEIRVPGFLSNIASKSYKGFFGTFFMGLTLGIVAAPCVGPFILGLFTYVGHLGDPFLGFLYFFILSIGMGLPLCVLAIFSGGIDKLPMSGDWMLWIRKLMGWVLIGMAAYFLRPLFTSPLAKSIIITLVTIVAGVHLGWIDKTGKGLRRFILIKRVVGIAVIIIGLIYFIPSTFEKPGVEWKDYYDNVLIDAKQKNMPVIIDVYADWCKPCYELDERVFHAPEVVELSKDFIMVRLDVTQKRPFHEDFRLQYDFLGVPTVLFFNTKGKEERELRVEYLVTKYDFLKRMKKLLEKIK